MIASEDQIDLDIDHLIAGENTAFHGLDDSLFNRRDVFTRNDATNDLVVELEAGSGLIWLDLDDYVTVLSTSTGLAGFSSPFAGRRMVSR